MDIVKILKSGGVGVVPTDTIYGLVGSALRPETVERIYKLRERNKTKPMIILVSSKKDLTKFGVEVTPEINKILDKYWTGRKEATSIILPLLRQGFGGQACSFEYLHRGTGTLAFRLPRKRSLLEILKKTGPLVAPSANPEGLPPATNIREAKKYFPPSPKATDGQVAPTVDFYLAGGTIKAKPSKIIEIKDGQEIVIRA